jgi:hypothetical protein
MARYQNPSATDSGKTEEFHLQLARGHISNHSAVNKFGWNAGVGTSFETIWDGSNVYTYHNAGTAVLTADTPASDNACTVEIQGLDENFTLQTETATVGGSATTTQFSRVFRMILKTANTGTTNADEIRCTVDNTTAAVITAGGGQTQMALYTIPAGKTGYLKKFQGSIDKQKEVVFRIISRDNDSDGAFTEKARFGTFGVPVTYDYPVPLKFSANTDIQVQAKAGATTEAGAIFDLILVDGQDTVIPGTGVS